MLESVFDEWVREAEEKLRASGDYPLVDSSEIDMTPELQRIAGRTVQEELEGSSYETAEIERAVEFLELRLIRSGYAPAVRFVILNFLYRLASFNGFRLAESAALLHGVIWPHFERFVGLPVLEPGALHEPRAIQWEITNACLSYKWDLAAALFDRLKSLGALTEWQCRAFKGQMYVCSVVAPRDEDDSGGSQGHLAWWWLPQLDSAFFAGVVFDSNHRAPTLLGWGMTLADKVEYSAEERARLSDATHYFETAFGKDSDLLSSYQAAWGKCYFITENYAKAAERFEHLLAHDFGLPEFLSDTEAGLRCQLYQNVAECHAKGGAAEAAVRALESCAQEFPAERGVWLKLAKLYLSWPLDVDPGKVLDCLRKEEEIDPSFGDDPRGSIALMLGEVAGSDLRATLRKVAESNPADLRFMNAVVSRHWAPFRSLNENSQKEWVGAIRSLWVDPLGGLTRRRVAGTFADIFEDQLRRLFDCFRLEKGSTVRAENGAQLEERQVPEIP